MRLSCEQWNDANNLLTVKPGVVIGYERNVYTNEKYDKAGIKVLTIPGNELGTRTRWRALHELSY